MTTNSAGSSGYRDPRTNGANWIRKKLSYTDWPTTTNAAVVVGVLPPRSMVIGSFSHVGVRVAFNDTSTPTLDIGITGGDSDWFASQLSLATAGGLLTLDDLTDTERYSASERTVTANPHAATNGNGSAGEVWVYIGYLVLDT